MMKYGSRLYGTNLPTSDEDYKGVYLPSHRDLLLNRVPKSYTHNVKASDGVRNAAGDVDREVYSLHYFIELCCRGETVALDMLHAPEDKISLSSGTWLKILENRDRFYTKNLKSLVCYARKQAAKYGVKGDRLAAARRVLKHMEEYDPCELVQEVFKNYPEEDHARWVTRTSGVSGEVREEHFFEVCGKRFNPLAKAGHYDATLVKYIDEYGRRARAAEQNQGIDWKAIYHAFRAGYQVRYILKDGGFTYPLPETDWLMAVRQGEVDYLSRAAPELDKLLDEVEELSAKSNLPSKVDRNWWDDWLYQEMWYYYGCLED